MTRLVFSNRLKEPGLVFSNRFWFSNRLKTQAHLILFRAGNFQATLWYVHACIQHEPLRAKFSHAVVQDGGVDTRKS